MPDFWTEFDQSHQGPACMRGNHELCSHFVAMGGALNPRRLRLEFGAALCRCSCHADCPVTSKRLAIPCKEWRTQCRCPGALPPDGSGDHREQALRALRLGRLISGSEQVTGRQASVRPPFLGDG